MTAIGVPIVEDKIDAWKAWITDECLGSRKEEFEEFNERMGLTAHRVWLSESLYGPLVIVVYEGPGEKTFLQKLGTSTHPFDQWFRDCIEEFHGRDFSELGEMKASEMVLNWRTPSYAEIGE